MDFTGRKEIPYGTYPTRRWMAWRGMQFKGTPRPLGERGISLTIFPLGGESILTQRYGNSSIVSKRSPPNRKDANGNTLTDASGKSYAWDFENRLTQAVVPGTNGGTTTFKYDPFGRRIQKISPNFTSIFVYDGPNLIETANGIER
jgi:YD repeat-containing protein